VRTSPTRVPGPARVQAITAGSVHSCARTETGSVWCWGGNEYGQVGNGTTGSFALPQLIGDRRFEVVVANGAHTCALAAREVWCWGYNADGQVAPRSKDDTGESATQGTLHSAVTRPMRVRGVNGGGV
jgi:alpha-tubulin suppressor-like RCC1 family protein